MPRDVAERSAQTLTVEFVGSPVALAQTAARLKATFAPLTAMCEHAAAAMRKSLEGVDMEAVERVGEHLERDERLMRRYGTTKLRDAPVVLRLIEDAKGSVLPQGRCRPITRARGRRPTPRRSRSGASRASPSSDSDEPAPPLGRHADRSAA